MGTEWQLWGNRLALSTEKKNSSQTRGSRFVHVDVADLKESFQVTSQVAGCERVNTDDHLQYPKQPGNLDLQPKWESICPYDMT
jgi:hypothetical protein